MPEAQALRCGQRRQHLQGAGPAAEQAMLISETHSQQTDWQQHDEPFCLPPERRDSGLQAEESGHAARVLHYAAAPHKDVPPNLRLMCL